MLKLASAMACLVLRSTSAKYMPAKGAEGFSARQVRGGNGELAGAWRSRPANTQPRLSRPSAHAGGGQQGFIHIKSIT